MRIVRGTVLLVRLDPAKGHEQSGLRPCIAVSDPAVASEQRYPVVSIVPVTGTPLVGRLYPMLVARAGGLKKTSWALADQVRSIDKGRIEKVFVSISALELQAIDGALSLLFGLPVQASP